MQLNELDYNSYRQQQTEWNVTSKHTQAVVETVDAYQSATVKDDTEAMATAANTLISLLNIDVIDIHQYDDILECSDLEWHPDTAISLLTFEDTAELLEQSDKQWCNNLGSTLTSLAVAQGKLDAAIQTEQPAFEYETRVGTRYVRATSEARGELDLIDRSETADLKATLFTGSQGAGKSTALGTVVEDRIERGHTVFDIVDFYKGENAVYDVEDDHDSVLQNIREEHGLEKGFEGYGAPTIDILAPLTFDLALSRVPFRETDDGKEPSVTAFTIPASDLTFRQLVMLLPHTTKTQQGYLKSAHHYLTQSGDDWTLLELAKVVRHKTNAGDKIADRIERSLSTAQAKSFIRDKQSEHVLEWEKLMQKERHVSAFTVHMIEEKSDKLAVVSYLIDRLHGVRNELLRRHKLDDTDTYPPLTVVMRELHTIAPRLKSEQDSESTIQGYMIDTMKELLALMRHANMEVIADTQKFHQQLSPQVSGLFHRVYCFSGQKPDVRKVFKTRIDDTGPAEDVAQYDTGMCALVSSNGYKLPIAMAPPRFHHLDASQDGSGLTYRAKQLEDEFLDDSPWSATIPPRLRFEGRFDPREAFWERFVRETGDPDDRVIKDRITAMARSWFDEHDYPFPGDKQFKGWVRNTQGVEEMRTTVSTLLPDQSEWCRMNDIEGRVYAFRGIVVDAPPTVDAEHDPVAAASD